MSDTHPSKLLFCLLNNKISGGNRILLELANRSQLAGLQVDLSFLDNSGEPGWFDNKCPITKLDSTVQNYHLVCASNVSAIPLLLPFCDINKLVLISQGFESYCYGETITELFSAKEPLENILKLQIPIIATSKSIQSLLKDKVGRASYLVPVAIDRNQFPRRQAVSLDSSTKRILAVGDFKLKFKGVFDLADALDVLSKEFPIELVLLTQQKGGRDWFKRFSFPIEFNHNPPQSELPQLYSSCHAYCCASWYEGFGLPCLEAFSVGTPVVSTNNFGVEEFARSGENMLLARAHSPDDLAAKLRLVLTDESLRSKLVKNGTEVAEQYTWQQTMSHFFNALNEIAAKCEESSPAPSQEELSSLLQNLEDAGYYTPRYIEQELVSLSTQLQTLCASVKDGSLDQSASLQTLQQIRLQLQKHLQNPSTSYYREFKARFDLCQIFRMIDDPKDWQKLLNF